MTFEQIKELKIQLGNAKDISNKKFGKFMPIFRVNNSGSKTRWACLIVGTENYEVVDYVTIIQSGLAHGDYTQDYTDYMIGKKFNHLTVIKKSDKSKPRRIYYDCFCDCGNPKYVTVRKDHLLDGHTTSCGCEKEPNLTGMRFGRLTVVAKMETQKGSGYNLWECKCDCGNTTCIRTADLMSSNTQSCGCIKSIGEANIKKRFLPTIISNLLHKSNLMIVDFLILTKWLNLIFT